MSAKNEGVAYLWAFGGNIYACSLPPDLNGNTVQLNGTPQPASLHANLRLHAAP